MHFCCRKKKKRISFWLRWTTKSRDETIYRDYFHPAHTHTCSHTHTRTLMHLSLATHMHSHFLRSTHSLSLIHSFSLFLSSIQNLGLAVCLILSLAHTHTHSHTPTRTSSLRTKDFCHWSGETDARKFHTPWFIVKIYSGLLVSLTLTLSLSLTHTHTHSLSLFLYAIPLSLISSSPPLKFVSLELPRESPFPVAVSSAVPHNFVS